MSDETPVVENPKRKKIFSSITSGIIIFSCAFIVFTLGFRTGVRQEAGSLSNESNISVKNLKEGNKEEIDFGLFWEAWNALDKYYIDKKELDVNKLYYGAIQGMVASLGDDYTYFLTPEEYKQSEDDLQGKFQGIGAELGLEDGLIIIVTPLKGSPAEAAGLRPSDVIMKVDGKDVEGWSLNEAVSKIRGPQGKKVTLTIFRPTTKKEVVIPIIRDEIKVESVELEFENNVAIIELSRFGEFTLPTWDGIVEKIVARRKNGTLDGIVLDMRGNPGGFLDGAIYIAAEFLPSDAVVVKQEYADKKQDVYTAERDGRLQDIPLVILINEGSASASEIVAGALRDNKKAKLVGMKSFGKGTVQQVFELSEKAGIHVTISRWVLPKGDWIHKNGIKPDVEIDNELEEGFTLTRETDVQLDKALEVLLEKK